MHTIRWRPAVLGALFAVVSYYVLVIGLLVPLAEVLVAADPGVVTVVVVGLQGGLLLLAGSLVASLVRREWGLNERREAVRTVVTAGLLGWLLVSVLTVAATLLQGVVVPVGSMLVTLVLWTLVPLAGGAMVAPGAPRQRTNRYVARLESEAGEVAAEYAGTIIVAILLIGSLLLTVSPGGAVSEHLKYVICQALTFGQGGCEAPSATAGEDPHKPTDPCVLTNSTDSRDVALSVMFVAAKGGGTIKVETMSDGTYRVSQEGSIGAGLTEGLSVPGGSVTLDDSVYGVEAGISGSVYLDGAAGLTWVVDEGTKDDLVDYLKEQRDLTTLSTLGGPVGSILAGGKSAWSFLSGDRYTPPAPDEVYGHLGASADGSANASGMVASASASTTGAAALGYRINTKDMSITRYYTYTLSGEADAAYDDALDHAEAGASGSVELMVAVTFDADDNPLKVDVQGQAVGEWKAQVTDLYTDGDPRGPSDTGGVLYSASMDLTRSEAASVGTDLLHATGIIPADRDVVDQAGHAQDAFDTFVDAARERGVITRQDLETDSVTPFAIQGGGSVGPVGLGGSFKNSTSTVDSTGGEYYSDGLWKEWVECA